MNGLPPTPPRSRARKRIGRCYELAGKALLDDAGKGWRLVHGVCSRVPGLAIDLGHAWLGHAWLARDGWTYDVVYDDELLPAEEQAREYGSIAVLVLNRKDAARRIAAEGNWGPWRDSRPLEGKQSMTR